MNTLKVLIHIINITYNTIKLLGIQYTVLNIT